MKKLYKLLTILSAFLLMQNVSYAIEDITSYCPLEPYPVGGKIASAISKITGTNWLFSNIAENRVKYALKKETNSDFDVKIKPFGGKNLIEGKFKSLNISSDNVKYEGFYVSDLKAYTLCDYNQVKFNSYDFTFPENLVLKYEGKITQSDLNKSILRSQYREKINKFNQSFSNILSMKIYEPQFTIANNRIYMDFKVLLPFIGTKTISSDFSLKADNGQVVVADFNISNALSFSSDNILAILNIFNPLNFDVSLNKNDKALNALQNINITNNEIIFDGVFIVPKSV